MSYLPGLPSLIPTSSPSLSPPSSLLTSQPELIIPPNVVSILGLASWQPRITDPQNLPRPSDEVVQSHRSFASGRVVVLHTDNGELPPEEVDSDSEEERDEKVVALAVNQSTAVSALLSAHHTARKSSMEARVSRVEPKSEISQSLHILFEQKRERNSFCKEDARLAMIMTVARQALMDENVRQDRSARVTQSEEGKLRRGERGATLCLVWPALARRSRKRRFSEYGVSGKASELLKASGTQKKLGNYTIFTAHAALLPSFDQDKRMVGPARLVFIVNSGSPGTGPDHSRVFLFEEVAPFLVATSKDEVKDVSQIQDVSLAVLAQKADLLLQRVRFRGNSLALA